MKHLLLLISFFFALHCQAQEPRMTEEEQRQAINTLMAYAQYVDSAYIQGAIERSAAVNAILTNHEQNFDTAFYLNNMASIAVQVRRVFREIVDQILPFGSERRNIVKKLYRWIQG